MRTPTAIASLSRRTVAGALTAATIAAALFTAACVADPAAPDARADLSAAASREAGQANAAVNRDLATLRQSLARFHNFDAARNAGGYSVLFDNKCFELPGTGGMGLHYVNLGLVNAVVELDKPEALLYEPGPGGAMVLVGVEYVVDPQAWNAVKENKGKLPRLFGRDYSYNATYGLYTLHVWTHKNNPTGTFEGWNPNVSCQYWTADKAMQHH